MAARTAGSKNRAGAVFWKARSLALPSAPPRDPKTLASRTRAPSSRWREASAICGRLPSSISAVSRTAAPMLNHAWLDVFSSRRRTR